MWSGLGSPGPFVKNRTYVLGDSMIAENWNRNNPSKAANLGGNIAACGIKRAKAPCSQSSRVYEAISTPHLCHRESPLGTTRSPHPTFVIASPLWGRSDLQQHLLSSRVYEAISTPRLCHRESPLGTKRSPLPPLSSRACEAISTSTPVIASLQSDLHSHT